MKNYLTPGGEPRAFVIVSSSRSGSNLLVKYARQVSDAAAFGEIFRDDYVEMNAFSRLMNRLDLPADTADLHRQRLTEFWELVLWRILERKRWAGAKIFYYHRRGDPLWDRIGLADHRIIHLCRDSTFDQYVSRLHAFSSGQWKSQAGQAGGDPQEKVHFDAVDYIEFRATRREDVEATRRRYAGTDTYVEVEYSQLTDHDLMAQLLEQMFGERVDVKEKLQRQLTKPKIDYISNPDDAAPFEADSITGGYATPS